MLQYLPFGKEMVMTNEQIEEQENKFKLYEEYGIPYGIFDDKHTGEQFASKKEQDREIARIFIMQNKEIPEELKKRLLHYKEQERTK